MALQKRVLKAYLFKNGALAVFDIKGKQIYELQGEYSIEKHKRILLESHNNCIIKGFEILPPLFILVAKEYADYFREKNLSWEEIKNL